MNYLFFVLSVFVSLSLTAQEETPIGNLDLKKGLQLVYDVAHRGSEYQYIVDFTTVSESEVVFDWKMTEPVNKSGTITLTAKALKEGSFLRFYPSTITYDNKDICMLIGSEVFKNILDIENQKSVTMSCDACIREVTLEAIEKFDYFSFNAEDKEVKLSAVFFKSIYNNGEFQILNNPKFPLILFFNFNMTIALKSFRYL
jgi:hypothetical protein